MDVDIKLRLVLQAVISDQISYREQMRDRQEMRGSGGEAQPRKAEAIEKEGYPAKAEAANEANGAWKAERVGVRKAPATSVRYAEETEANKNYGC